MPPIPANPAPFAPVTDDRIDAILADHRAMPGALLPILHAVQDAFGHVPDRAIPRIALALNVTRAEVHGVVSFYHDFRTTPPGRQTLRLCRAEACQAMGGTAVAQAVLDRLGVDWHGTTPDGAITVEPVYCLGLCACAPAAMLGDTVLGRATPARVAALLEGARA